MMDDVLVSPLGRSPGAVCGVYFALKAEHPDLVIGKVITVGTSHPDVLCASKCYLKELFEHCGVAYEPIHVPALDLRGGSREVKPYVAMLGMALEEAYREGEHVHVAVTAGRSGMGALAALATNLYGADYLWHLWVKRDIEEMGAVDKLSGLTQGADMVVAPALNPTVEGKEAYELVDLPFMDLRPLHAELLQYLRTGKVPAPESPLATLFSQMGVENLKQVFPAGLTIANADEILRMKAQYTRATSSEQARIMVDLGELLQRAGVVTKSEEEALVDLVMAGNVSLPELISFAKRSKDRSGFWKFLLNWFAEHKDAIGSGAQAGGIFLTMLELYLKVRGIIS